MLVVDANGDPTDETTPRVSNANACTTRTINEAWYTSDWGTGEGSVYRALRSGDARVLNVYFKAAYSSDGSRLLGYANFPSGYVTNRYADRAVVDDIAIVGGSAEAYSEGVSIVRKKKESCGIARNHN
jgi:hypothetical protein